ncbi:glutamyl-tRNA synthetase [Rhizoctonia solani AG-1 IB]|uniref:Glutamate--tRNA ligase, mitochondrial n=1 Tax=Thanatephorus cucumeris (strain AG1-IB / isolate 7/3/14) TaxID=1108050 RepID=A0A0B7FSW4_THACB|nr:glutamyl-tRNA synthetase [Rhizoctonia solani AG-1 IB]
MKKIPRLRFAPSPTGSLHLGGLRTALFNHVMARKLGGEWALRIEDTDRSRLVPGSIDEIRKGLEWAGVMYDHGPGLGGPHAPYTQSERLDLYHQYAKRLLDSGHAYRCFCGPERLSDTKEKLQKLGSNSTYDRACLNLSEEEISRRVRAGEKHVVRLNDTTIQDVKPVPDLVFGTSVQHTHAGLPTDPILLKSDLFPTYHLASVVDDHEMEITHVLRGEEWLPSLPLHLDLYSALGLEPPSFGHLPLLLNPDGTKMSKRKGDVRVLDYMEKGWEPEAVVNWLALTGWNVHRSTAEHEPGTPGDMMTLEQIIHTFDISHLTHRRTILDPGKLAFLNRHHLHKKVEGITDQLIAERAAGIIRAAYPDVDPQCCTKDYISRVLRVLSDRVVILQDIATAAPYFFQSPDYTSDAAVSLRKTVKGDIYPRVLKQALRTLDSVPYKDATRLHDTLESLKTELGVGTRDVMNTMRHALTGSKIGPSVVEILGLLGQERTNGRLKAALEGEL